MNEEVEILFPENGSILPLCMYSCDYDAANGYRMELRDALLSTVLYTRVDYVPEKACIWFKDVTEPQIIPFEVAVELLKNNPTSFDNTTNINAQNLAYSMCVVDRE